MNVERIRSLALVNTKLLNSMFSETAFDPHFEAEYRDFTSYLLSTLVAIHVLEVTSSSSLSVSSIVE